MNNWSEGYVTEISYTSNHYDELNPLRTRIALLNNGIVCPRIDTACELGFGQGVSVNIHAAASSCSWHGTDFNPTHASFAQEVARASGANAELFDETFSEFCNRSDIPDFDFISLHGIWSWISEENRKCILDFIKRKLKVGGVLYISYNTYPGWSAVAPLRELMAQRAMPLKSGVQNIGGRIDESLNFVHSLFSTNPKFLKANPQIAEHLSRLKKADKKYIAHEYFNQNWRPSYFSEMANDLDTCKMEFACSADYISQIGFLNFTKEQLDFLAQIEDTTLTESVKDFMGNVQFRKDYWVKGLRKMSLPDQIEEIKREEVVLTSARSNIPLKITCLLGEAKLEESIYNVVLDCMQTNNIITIGRILDFCEEKGVTLPQVIECILVLIHCGHMSSVSQSHNKPAVQKSCQRLNQYVINSARGESESKFLASPVTGSGILVTRIELLFLKGVQEKIIQADELALFAWQALDSQGQRVLKDGVPIDVVEDNIKELNNLAVEFLKDRLSILKSLDVTKFDLLDKSAKA
jgi:SAM-dependent methyltransferase